MIYTLKFSCGHEKKVSLRGEKKDKEAQANMLQSQLCDDCKGT